MKTMTANEAKQSFGQLLDDARREPVFIEKHKRRTAVVMSSEEYDRLRGLNIAQFSSFCAHIGQRAEASGLTEKKLKELVQ